MTGGTSKVSGANGQDRIVRYADLRPCFDAFIDTRTPGSNAKENFTIIGPGVSENPNQYVHIAEPHGFNIGGARQPPGCVNSQHSHETVEVFFVHSGTWSFNTGEHGQDAKVTLKPGDFISIPTQVFRGFENIGEDMGFLWAVLGKDNPGRVLWAPKVFEMAKDYGLTLLQNGLLIDANKGEQVPDNVAVMPPTDAQQVAALQRFGADQLRACCVMADEGTAATLAPGAQCKKLIGSDAKLSWDHGFNVEHMHLDSRAALPAQTANSADVVFVHEGQLTIDVEGEAWSLWPGDTATLPRGKARVFRNDQDKPLQFLRVTGTA